MYKKHRAFLLNRKVCVYQYSPLNITLGVYSEKSKIVIFNSVIFKNESTNLLPYFSYTNRWQQFLLFPKKK